MRKVPYAPPCFGVVMLMTKINYKIILFSDKKKKDAFNLGLKKNKLFTIGCLSKKRSNIFN